MWSPQQLLSFAGSSLDRSQLMVLLSRNQHVFGFCDSRALYINSRVRLLALIFALLTPLWIPVDFFILEGEQFHLMATVRLLFSLLLLMLAGIPATNVTFRQAQIGLLSLMVLPALFHLATQAILSGMPYHDLLVCYSFLPFLIIVMHCVFPLALFEGLLLAGLSITLLSLWPLFSGTLFSFVGLANLWLMCLLMGVAIWAQLSQLQMKLQLFDEATTDPLTGLLNRRTLMGQLEHIRRQLLRNGRPVSLLMLDLDHFKQINDGHGHQVGDRVLKHFAAILKQQARRSDYVARFGGEEFLIVLPEARPNDAVLLAERILNSCRSASVALDDENPHGARIGFSVSIGVAQLDMRNSIESSLSRVDAALYQAKQSGRDRLMQAA